MTTIKARYVVLGSMIGGVLAQLTFQACGGVKGISLDASDGGQAHADSAMSAATWSSYTPTFAIDGTTPSTTVRGATIRYVMFDKTICLQGLVVLGEQLAGSAGSLIKISVPPGHPGASGIKQYGIGSVIRTGDTTTPFPSGAAAIEADVNYFVLVKQSVGYFSAADARPGAGINWVASGCYESI